MKVNVNKSLFDNRRDEYKDYNRKIEIIEIIKELQYKLS